jgi:hypothetical protein
MGHFASFSVNGLLVIIFKKLEFALIGASELDGIHVASMSYGTGIQGDKKLDKREHTEVTQSKEQSVSPKLDDPLPENFPVSVILESRPSSSQWLTTSWKVIGITIGSRSDAVNEQPKPINKIGDITQYICDGLSVALYKDECESYYHNLMSPTPRCYVIAHVENYDEPPDPFLVSMSFDEAHAYLEGEDDIFDVDVPPELYRWVEAFVLVHHAQEKRVKRKRKDWKSQERPS